MKGLRTRGWLPKLGVALLTIGALQVGSTYALAATSSSSNATNVNAGVAHNPPVFSGTEVTFTIPPGVGTFELRLGTKFPPRPISQTVGSSGTLSLPLPIIGNCQFQADVRVRHRTGGTFLYWSGARGTRPDCSVTTTTTGKAQPALFTVASPDVTVGAFVEDKAVVSGLVDDTGTGTITFDAYSNSSCSHQEFPPTVDPERAGAAGNGDYFSAEDRTTAVGKVYWVVSYSGDAHNLPVQSGCDVEVSDVLAATTTTTSEATTTTGPTSTTTHGATTTIAATSTTVTPTPGTTPTTPSLPFTGANTMLPAGAGIAAILAGIALLAVSRRRTDG